MTPAQCKEATAGAVLKDNKVAGLQLHVFPSGRRVWYLYHRTQSGQRRKPTLGDFPTITLDRARDVARDVLRRVAGGEDVAAGWREKRERMAGATVADLFAAFLLAKGKTVRASTAAQYRTEFATWRGSVATAVAESLTRADVGRWLALYDDAPGAGNHALRLLRNVLAWALREKRLAPGADGNPAVGHEMRPEEPGSRILTPTEIRELWGVPGDYADAARLILLLGQRPGEVLGMRRDEANLDRAEWVLPAARTKNGREHEVPLPPLARRIVASRLGAGHGAFLFPGRGGGAPRDRRTLTREFARWQKGAEALWYTRGDGSADPVTPHDLRRTCSSYLLLLGHGESAQAAVLNHSPGKSVTSKHYSSADLMSLKRQALLDWEVAVRTILAGGDPFAVSLAKDREAEEKALAAFLGNSS